MLVFIGCYTKKITEEIVGKGSGIYAFKFDSENGELTLLETIHTKNPSYMAINSDQSSLYVAEEIDISEKPKISSYTINSESSPSLLTYKNSNDLPGSFPCHLNLINGESQLAVACYLTGNVLIYDVINNGEIGPLTQNIQHHGSGPNLGRQEAAHAHMIYPFGVSGFYAVDLGIDKAKFYNWNTSKEAFTEDINCTLSVSKGSGARHMAIHPSKEYAFIFGELTSELFSFRIIDNKIELLETLESLPENWTDIPSGAAIKIHPNGKYIYVSNRGFNAISIFEFSSATEKLRFIKHVPSGGKTPRDFNIDPSGNWLLVANQDTDNIVVFNIDQSTGDLTKKSMNHDVKTPSCIQFV